jgi:hypothetical protein
MGPRHARQGLICAVGALRLRSPNGGQEHPVDNRIEGLLGVRRDPLGNSAHDGAKERRPRRMGNANGVGRAPRLRLYFPQRVAVNDND